MPDKHLLPIVYLEKFGVYSNKIRFSDIISKKDFSHRKKKEEYIMKYGYVRVSTREQNEKIDKKAHFMYHLYIAFFDDYVIIVNIKINKRLTFVWLVNCGLLTNCAFCQGAAYGIKGSIIANLG